jgi:hypothetical protein
MSEAGSDSQLSAETVSGTPQSGAVLERGLPISGKSVPASSGKLADDVSPWDGQVYARGRDAGGYHPGGRRRLSCLVEDGGV